MKKIILAIVFTAFAMATAQHGFCQEDGGAPVAALALTANVGNADIMNCSQGYYYKLCQTKYEKKLTENIAKISPDLVALQEVMPTQWCDAMAPEKKKAKVCYRYKEREPYEQARRLLGDDYTIVCDGRSNFECIGVKKSFAEVEGCASGELCMNGTGLTHDVPEGCDEKAVIFGVDLMIGDKKMRFVNGHPIATVEDCRAGEALRMFEGYDDVPPLADANLPTLVMGDMNLDPFRDLPESPDIKVWQAHVGEGHDFYYLSGIAETDPPHISAGGGKTLDHVITNFANGKCQTLGEAEGTERLDGVPAEQYVPEANDHRAILCELELPLSDFTYNKN